MAQQLDNPAAIQLMVDTFYDRVMADNLLAPLFAHVDWAAHKPTMYQFWESMLLGLGTYRGNPMQAHLKLHAERYRMLPEHFDRWLQLFSANMAEHFTGPIADEALSRAQGIANTMQYMLKKQERGGI